MRVYMGVCVVAGEVGGGGGVVNGRVRAWRDINQEFKSFTYNLNSKSPIETWVNREMLVWEGRHGQCWPRWCCNLGCTHPQPAVERREADCTQVCYCLTLFLPAAISWWQTGGSQAKHIKAGREGEEVGSVLLTPPMSRHHVAVDRRVEGLGVDEVVEGQWQLV